MPRRADLLSSLCAAVVALLVLALDASGDARRPDLLGAGLVLAACAPPAVRREHPLTAAVIALPCACAALALGYSVILPTLVALTLCGLAALHSERRVTVPLAAFAGTLMAAAVALTGEDSSVMVRLVGGVAIGVTPVLIGHAVRSERERVREAREAARRIAELRDRDVERAVAEERLRIARDVHDITGHHLSAISLQAAGAGRLTSDPRAGAAFERIHRLTSEALGQTRRTLGALRETGPAARAPSPRLEHAPQLLTLARSAGIAAELRVDGAERPLSDEIEVCAYRVLQEALTNVVRHAQASVVHVRIGYGADALTVAVEDDGSGAPARPGGGIGGMRERVAIVGGTFAAGPDTRGGWSVRATLPLEAAPADAATHPSEVAR